MNKQELIEKLKGEQQRCDIIAGSDMYNYITASQPVKIAIQCQARAYKHAITLAQQLDEPSREECDYFTAPYNYGESTDIDYNVCNICNYHEQCNDKVKSNFDIWNYCPNCGAKIKKEGEK